MPPFPGVEEGVNRLSATLLRYSTVQSFLLSLTAAAFFLWRMSLALAEIRQITDVALLDSRWSYHPREAHSLIRELGRHGRELYLQINYLDFGFPFAFAAVCSILIGPIYQRTGLWTQVNVLPIIYLCLDLVRMLLSGTFSNTFRYGHQRWLMQPQS